MDELLTAFCHISHLISFLLPESKVEDFLPFKKDAVQRMAELSEFNASRILKMAYEVLERAVDENVEYIDAEFVIAADDESTLDEQKQVSGIHDAPTKNLLQESA
ncbi:hypothetical protein KFU94_51030 [Chloroflexi bacterium TSY]|nr:hypothetical protein [Chloroflexi bacterium TSY]